MNPYSDASLRVAKRVAWQYVILYHSVFGGDCITPTRILSRLVAYNYPILHPQSLVLSKSLGCSDPVRDILRTAYSENSRWHAYSTTANTFVDKNRNLRRYRPSLLYYTLLEALYIWVRKSLRLVSEARGIG